MACEVAVHGKHLDAMKARDRHDHEIHDGTLGAMTQQHPLVIDDPVPQIGRILQNPKQGQIQPRPVAFLTLRYERDDFRPHRMAEDRLFPGEELSHARPTRAGAPTEIVHPCRTVRQDGVCRYLVAHRRRRSR